MISGAGAAERIVQAMASVDRELILQQEQLALLFTPPFDRTPLDPGYIKAYRRACSKTAASTPMPPHGR